MGFRAMMEHSAERETTPTLWIIIPFITVIGIAFYRLNKGLITISASSFRPDRLSRC
jgi:hypothetical protein